MNKQQALKIFNILKKHYPNAETILKFSNNFELLVSVMLSAQTTDLQVNKVTALLFPKYQKQNPKCLKHYDQLKNLDLSKKELIEIINFAEANLVELENDIKSIGLFKTKARNIQAMAKLLLRDFKGLIPKTITELTSLPGVGRKTANVVLANAYGITEGIAVDTHVKKLSLKYGLTKNTNPDKIEKDLMHLFPKEKWIELTYLLIDHGRNLKNLKQDFIS